MDMKSIECILCYRKMLSVCHHLAHCLVVFGGVGWCFKKLPTATWVTNMNGERTVKSVRKFLQVLVVYINVYFCR